MKRKFTIKRYKPRTLGYIDRHGEYHGPYKVSGNRRYNPVITMSKAHARTVCSARNKLRNRR